MAKAFRSIRSFAEIAEFVAEEGATLTDDFSQAFTETVEGYRISTAEDAVTCDMPDALQVQLATEMVMRTLFDVLRDSPSKASRIGSLGGLSTPSIASPTSLMARPTRQR
jgi:uncharacterized protein YdeI (YjbR/CyaY-like superfamily)